MPINEKLRKYFATELGESYGTLPDLENKWLRKQVGEEGTTPDLWYRYLLGLGYSGTISDMKSKWIATIDTPSWVPPDLWLDPSDLDTLFQDAAGTTPVTAPGQSVGLVLDKSGNGYHAAQPTAAARPTLLDVSGNLGLRFDLAVDALTTTLPQAINGDILIAGTKGSVIETVSYAAGSTFTVGPDTYTGGTTGILRSIGDVVGIVLIDRSLTQVEKDQLIRYYKAKGAKGLLVPGPELFPNPDFNDGLNSYTAAGATISLVGGNLQYIGTSFAHYVAGPAVTQVGKVYQINVLVESITRGTPLVTAGLGGSPSGELRVGDNRLYLSHLGTVGSPIIASDTEAVISLFSVRELRPQEDWT